MKILVVEDNPIAAHHLVRTLEKMSHEAHHEGDGARAWQALQEQHFDMIISDWEMPEVDGLELCRMVRSRQGVPYIYYILLTVKEGKDNRYIGLEAGADDFLVKPLDPTELMARLEVASRILGMQEQLASTVLSLDVAKKRFSELFMGLPIAGMTIDANGKIQEWNRACVSLLGIQDAMLFESDFLEVFAPVGMEGALQPQIDGLLKGYDVVDFEWHYTQPNGSLKHLLWNAIPLTNTQGIINGALHTLIDITNLKRTEQQVRQYSAQLERNQEELRSINELLQKQASTDALTGLNNHRAFQETYAQEYQRTLRYHLPLSVVMVDVDYFKQYNDSFGHPAGDEVLKAIGGILKEAARTSDYAARYGGEEFVLILSNTTKENAEVVAERVRKSIESHAWTLRPITASIGISSLRLDTLTSAQLLEEADQALYQSKRSGRNRVTCFAPKREQGAEQAA
jgi:diguanylate cyclase (GGDEF)-like protein/PAS domain S-box-containing protein